MLRRATLSRAWLTTVFLLLLLLHDGSGSAKSLTSRPIRVAVIQTNTDLSRRLSRMPDLTFRHRRPGKILTINVDDGQRYQSVTGVGGGLTDSSAWLIQKNLGRRVRAALIKNLFGRRGAHLTFIRIPIGASDFTVHRRPYSYDDLPRGRSDPRLKHFSVAHDDRYIVPVLRQTMRIDAKTRLLAALWSPPRWMKANHAFGDTNFAGSLLSRDRQPLASYFVRFVQAYARRHIHIWGLAPQNEPWSGAPFPAMVVPESDEANWIVRDLKPALEAARLRTGIYGSETGFSNVTYPLRLISGVARTTISGITQHCYNGTPNVLSTIHSMAPQLELVVSKCAIEISPYAAPEIVIGSMRNWASTVALWNLALDPGGGPVEPPNRGCGGCRGLVAINERTHRVTYRLPYYQLGQFGRYVHPGARRVASPHFVNYYYHSGRNYGVTQGIDDVAFVNPDGGRVLVAYNSSRRATRFAVTWHGESFTYNLASRATVTFHWSR